MALAAEPAVSLLPADPNQVGRSTEPPRNVEKVELQSPLPLTEPPPGVEKETTNPPVSSTEPPQHVEKDAPNPPVSSTEPPQHVEKDAPNPPVSSTEPPQHVEKDAPDPPVSSTEPPPQVEEEEDKFDHTIIPFEEAFQHGDNRNVPWYRKEVGEISPAGLDMLEKYSKIAPDDTVRHILEVRDRAWDVWPYPCIGNFLFLDLTITEFDFYPQIVKRLKEGQSFLDIGCCFAQDLRKLVRDGAPSENLYGSDLEAGFLDLGYELFLDKDTLKSTFFPANALDPDSPLKDLNGKIDIIYAGFFFHLFSFDQSLDIVERFIKILKPQKGSLICGKQSGCTTADTELQDFKAAGKLWRHNPETWTKLWEEASRRTGTKWRINTWMVNDGKTKAKWSQLNREWLFFEIEREE